MYEKQLMLMVGPIGCGKTTLAKSFENDNSIRISQDEMGRKAYLKHFHDAVEQGVGTIIIDRMNFNKEQRERFIKPAREAGYAINVFIFEWDMDVCRERVLNRQDHPTVPAGDPKLTDQILKMYVDNYEVPTKEEYDNYNLVKMEF